MRPKLLFLCTGNSCRSQMAEGWAKTLIADKCDAYSAGTLPQGLNRLAVSAMSECGIDISSYQSKSLEDLSSVQFDLIITVCDQAASACPTPPNGSRIIHIPFDDPPKLAKDSSTDRERMIHYRRVRDEIKMFVLSIPSLINQM